VANLPPGQRLAGQFTIKSHLGQGSMGTVYLAFNALRSVDVALKVVPVTSEEIVRQLRHEVEQNFMVRDFNYVTRIDELRSARYAGIDLLLIPMEYASGGSFRQWLVQNRDNVVRRRSEGVAHILQACKGLKVLHAAGIVHLDLKPENLLFFGDVLKVADLGLSRLLTGGNVGEGDQVEGREQLWAGTPAYMSREQFIRAYAARLDERSDIYSIGAVLFETCDERCRPLLVGSYDQVREAHLYMPAPQIRDVEAHVARVIRRCLQRDPADRYADVSELIVELEGDIATQDEGPVAGQRAIQIKQLWQQACGFVQGRNLDSASSACQAILEITPEHDNARHMLQDIQCRFGQTHQFYTKLQRGIGCQSFDRLLALLAAAVEIYPDHPEGALVQTQLRSIMIENKLAMQNAKVAFGQRRWQATLTYLERAGQLNPGQPAVTHAVALVHNMQRQIETTRRNVATTLEQGNRQKALLLARNLDTYIEQVTAFARQLPSSESDHDTRT